MRSKTEEQDLHLVGRGARVHIFEDGKHRNLLLGLVLFVYIYNPTTHTNFTYHLGVSFFLSFIAIFPFPSANFIALFVLPICLETPDFSCYISC
ncbi:hypothetical protein L6452_35099 [Arctium lappa]|uniref:Uncharacterized protein n=1 Tax=Arctium lappa TaxID=4217 RepID=A0ACB8YLJ9_ARCLA|nr:hypothetical protein L6452_35099 [Arctium lappa]